MPRRQPEEWIAVVQERSDAIVLRGVDYSETSRIITLLTPGRGKLTCIAKGARRSKGGLGPTLDNINRIEAVYLWKDGRDIQTLTDATLLDAFAPLKRDFDKSSYAAFPLELADRIAHDNEPSERLYAELSGGLESLAAWSGAAATFAVWLAWRLLSVAGFTPTFDTCVHCGERLGGGKNGFSFEGGAVCGNCPADRRPDAMTFAQLRALATAPACPDLPPAPVQLAFVRDYASRQMDCAFRSTRVIEELFGETARQTR
ncbi:MAG: DNA repair protein RecO [Candidatus Hydrogenedentales bacterium]